MTLPNATLGGIAWGDGHDDKRVHVIERISYADGYIYCRCTEERIDGATPNELAAAWTLHSGREPFSGRGFENRNPAPSAPDLERMEAALSAIRDMQAQCTCATTAVEDCPNYQPGDELPEEAGDE